MDQASARSETATDVSIVQTKVSPTRVDAQGGAGKDGKGNTFVDGANGGTFGFSRYNPKQSILPVGRNDSIGIVTAKNSLYTNDENE